jgi:hypothetical protein
VKEVKDMLQNSETYVEDVAPVSVASERMRTEAAFQTRKQTEAVIAKD